MGPVEAFNALPARRAEEQLLACCAVEAWAARVTAGRPYPGRPELLAAADAALRTLSWSQVAQALAAHPRIGQPPAGDGREAGWSRREQAGVAGADAGTRAALARTNGEYERRFGHLFLVFAHGKTDTELLAAARARLANDEATERAVVAEELRKIAMARLARLLDGG